MEQISEEIRDTPAEPVAKRAVVSVLLIGPSFEIVGGQTVQAAHLMKVLSEAPGQKMTFFPINPRPPKPFLWVRKIPFLRTIVNAILYHGELLFAARKHDVLHIFTAGLHSYTLWTIPALLYGKMYGKKLIVHYHDGRAEEHITKWRSAVHTLRWADRIVAPSGFLVDVFAKYGIKAESIFNILDAGNFIYRKRRKLRPAFMTNRSLEALYNIDCILRAFKIVQAKYPEASLTIAHDGVCRPALEKLAQDLELRNTRFIGKVPHDHIAELYDSADIYQTTPNVDCMPGSLLECFASGLPVVASKAGGIPYIAKDRYSALLVDLNDHEALAARSVELLENEDLVEQITANALEEVKQYNWKPIRDQWAALYREVVSGPES
jgi:glycosyltransferase involved in cell wall biosynthesis